MKRFTETTKWNDPWFEALPSIYKLFFLFLCDSCDNAGVWNVSLRTAKHFVDPAIELDEALSAFGNRVEDIGNDKWFLVKFISFQQKNILNEAIPAHLNIIRLLEKHGLYQRFMGGTGMPQVSHASGTSIPLGIGTGKGSGIRRGIGKGNGQGLVS